MRRAALMVLLLAGCASPRVCEDDSLDLGTHRVTREYDSEGREGRWLLWQRDGLSWKLVDEQREVAPVGY